MSGHRKIGHPDRVVIFLETNKFDKENQQSYLFTHPLSIIACYEIEEIEETFARMEEALKGGFYLAGFISYETGFAFEKVFKPKKRYTFPLIWFGVFKKPRTGRSLTRRGGSAPNKYTFDNLRLNISQKDYLDSIRKIKKLIERGETYQVNYTLKYKFNFSGSPYALYATLKNNQSVSYSAFIKGQNFTLLSFSPELFFRKNGQEIKVKPMKGTIERGRILEKDNKNAQDLKDDPKSQAENIMIVDLLRNDLGKISETGSVKVDKLFEIEKYETLFQMTSTIKGKVDRDIKLYELFKALFPSGSVTGAPKIRTMQLIDELEKEERKIYTGSIGFITPEKDAVFNVAIRTVLLENGKAPRQARGKGEMGIGSGIVYDSNPEKEFEECKLKANFLTQPTPEFQLIETLLWTPKKGYFLLEEHLRRLRKSAEYFDFLCDQEHLREKLNKEKVKFKPNANHRIRLLLFKDGRIKITSSKLEKNLNQNYIAFSNQKISSRNIFLYHKTTNRKLYNEEYQKYQKLGYFDVIFQNEKGEITEGAISNIFIKKNGIYYTPPVECGLLDGVYRRYFMSRNGKKVREKILYKEDLLAADEIYLTNAVRGMVKVNLERGGFEPPKPEGT